MITSANVNIRNRESIDYKPRGDYEHGDDQPDKIQDRLLREATGGLCRFGDDGEVVLAVDPAKYRGVS